MPRLSPNRAPSYRLHKQSGQAIVTFNGRDVVLGAYGSAESREKYDRLVAEWFQNGRELPRPKDEDVTVATVLAAFWRHVQDYYRRPDGTPSSEVTNFRYVLRPLRRLYGNTSAAEFGPKALKVVRDEMIRLGWVRSNVNRQINRLKHVFKWATQEELIPPSVYHGLQTVSSLRAGRSDAPESEPVRPVPEEFVQAVLPPCHQSLRR